MVCDDGVMEFETFSPQSKHFYSHFSMRNSHTNPFPSTTAVPGGSSLSRSLMDYGRTQYSPRKEPSCQELLHFSPLQHRVSSQSSPSPKHAAAMPTRSMMSHHWWPKEEWEASSSSILVVTESSTHRLFIRDSFSYAIPYVSNLITRLCGNTNETSFSGVTSRNQANASMQALQTVKRLGFRINSTVNN